MDDAAGGLPATLTARSLLVDVMTAEVVAALEDAGVEPIVLKGPSFAAWLYADGAARPYDDCDLLVDPDRLEPAQAVLRGLGFRYAGQTLVPDPTFDGLPWVRGHDRVDLHVTLLGMQAAPAAVWRELDRRTGRMRVAGRAVRTLDEPARALHAALHAAQHGRGLPKPLEDLRRALAHASPAAWEEAARLAAALDATAALAAGLSLVEGGDRLAGRLGLRGAEPDLPTALRASTPAPLALGLEELRRTPGARPKLRRLAGEVWPSRDFLRVWAPVARRGRRGMAAARVWRVAYLGLRAPAAVRSWLHAWRDVRS